MMIPDVYFYSDCSKHKDIWEKISYEHKPQCPINIAARKKIKSTFCVCKELEFAQKEAKNERTSFPV